MEKAYIFINAGSSTRCMAPPAEPDVNPPELTEAELERRAERDLERFKDLLNQIVAERQSR